MAGALFAPAQVGIVILPLMIFHQLQLFVCAWLAGRWRREGEALAAAASVPLPPQDEAAMLARAGEIGLPVPEECRPGVGANLALLTGHARIALGEEGA
jgi:sodium/bile acid cotransporter 7